MLENRFGLCDVSAVFYTANLFRLYETNRVVLATLDSGAAHRAPAAADFLLTPRLLLGPVAASISPKGLPASVSSCMPLSALLRLRSSSGMCVAAADQLELTANCIC